MTEDEFKPTVREIFKHLGLQSRDLKPVNNRLSPDFEVRGEHDTYTVELKIKGDSPEEVAKEIEALSQGGLVARSTPLEPRNTLAGVIRDGVEQMRAHDPTGKTFRVLWCHAAGQDPELHYDRFYATLFGRAKLCSLRRPNVITCFYFHESAFYSWRDYLDGAILTYLDTAQMCINTLSPRVEQFRRCEFVQAMSRALCDPDRLHGLQKDIMIADCPVDRTEPQRVLEYLRRKYDVDHLQVMPMKKHVVRWADARLLARGLP